jgi:linoleoyl-CoA desaturase
MTMTVKTANRVLPSEDLERFGQELDAVRARTVATIGQRDADYIRAIVAAVRWTGFSGRLLLWSGAIVGGLLGSVANAAPLSALVLGTLLLALSKIIENMELGHNVMHGQYDWMRDPHLDGKTYEWDIAGPGDFWRHTHNHVHHTWTNVVGRDRDIGYGVLRNLPWPPFSWLAPGGFG